MSDVPTISTAEVGGFRIDSNSGASKKDIETALAPPPPPGEDEKADPSKAASELGKLGGEASAKKRAAEAKEAKKHEKTEGKKVADGASTVAGDTGGDSGVSSAGSDEEKTEAEEKPEKPLGKPRDDPRARMLEATRKEAEAKRERDRIRADYDRLKAENEALKGAKPAEPKVEAKPSQDKPTPEAFESYEEYLDARDAWNRKRWTEEQSKERHNQEVEQQLDEVVDNLVKAVQDSGAREKFSEDITSLKSTFALMAENHRDGTQNPETARHWMMNEFLFSPEQAPALMLHLSEHPDEFQRIAALSTPRAVSRELAKIEARLEAATTGNGSKPAEEVSKAAPPVKPVSGAPYQVESAEYKPGESFDSYLSRHRRRPAATR